MHQLRQNKVRNPIFQRKEAAVLILDIGCQRFILNAHSGAHSSGVGPQLLMVNSKT